MRQGFHPGVEQLHLQLRAARGALVSRRAARSSGSSAITSTACASMPSPPCSISTTRASAGEWVPNVHGGRENLEAVAFLRQLNEAVYRDFPDVQTIAEESTAWPAVSRPVYVGGLGFGMKWNMGWMHDTLDYFSKDPVFRQYHHDRLTFSAWYAFSENFVAAALARRGGARQGLADRQDAGRQLAAIRQSALPLRLHVGPSRQEAPLHGRGIRPAPRMAARGKPRVARPASTPITAACATGCAI